jgi:hypothetical protein
MPDPIFLFRLQSIAAVHRDRFVQFLSYLFVLSRTSNFSAVWQLSPLPVTGLQI